MILHTPRLLLRPFCPADLEAVFHGLSHPDVVRHYGVRYASLDTTKDQLDWYATIEHDGTGLWRGIVLKEDGCFLGAIGLNNIVRDHCCGELGFWLMPEHQRKGYVSEALPVILAHGFGPLGLHRIAADVETENKASARLLLKVGFVHEGTLRECERKDGRWISLDVFARLAKDPGPVSH